MQELRSPPQDAIKSFFLPPAASQLGCDWRGMSLRQSRQVFLRYRQPWLMMHVRRRVTNDLSTRRVKTHWPASWVPRVEVACSCVVPAAVGAQDKAAHRINIPMITI